MYALGKRSFSSLAVGNWLYLPDNDTLYQVTGTTDSQHIQAAGMPGGTYTDLQWADSPNGASDYTITNNTFKNLPNALEVLAMAGGQAVQVAGVLVQRVKIENNIFYNIRDDLFRDPYPWNTSGGGWFVGLTFGTTDVFVNHNTGYIVKGQSSCGQGIFIQAPKLHESLLLQNNIVQTANPEQPIAQCSVFGTPQLDS